MNLTLKHCFNIATFSAVLLIFSTLSFAQVSPNEITDPQLKGLEQTYLPKLIEINRVIGTMTFPFPFSLNRYVGLDPKEQPMSDRRGLEFVNFHGRSVLKVTANYNAAFNTSLLTSNQRANKTFDEAILPVLRLMGKFFTTADTFDAFGFEIGYHVRTKANGVDYEGRENLVVVMDKTDASRYVSLQENEDRQQILNRAEIFLNGKPFGLQYGAGEPVTLEAANRIVLSQPPSITEGNVQKLQAQYQSQLDASAAEGISRFHFVQYAPPSLIVFREQLFLQLTLRNTEKFDREATSIYKRAAQSFDLFLAPQIKGILETLPNVPGMSGVGVTILNEVASKSAPSSEALEFFFPLSALRNFGNAGITNQELINQSIVLVNGVRISLDLQRVE